MDTKKDKKAKLEEALRKNLRKRKIFQRKNKKNKLMSVQSDKWIIKMAKEQAMISPFEDKQIREGKISFGVSSYGYDARVSNEFKIFTNVNSEIVDPKNFKPTNFVTKESDECIIPPNSFVLARTVEYFKIPSDVLVICLGKSTYARCGIIVNVTPL